MSGYTSRRQGSGDIRQKSSCCQEKPKTPNYSSQDQNKCRSPAVRLCRSCSLQIPPNDPHYSTFISQDDCASEEDLDSLLSSGEFLSLPPLTLPPSAAGNPHSNIPTPSLSDLFRSIGEDSSDEKESSFVSSESSSHAGGHSPLAVPISRSFVEYKSPSTSTGLSSNRSNRLNGSTKGRSINSFIYVM